MDKDFYIDIIPDAVCPVILTKSGQRMSLTLAEAGKVLSKLAAKLPIE